MQKELKHQRTAQRLQRGSGNLRPWPNGQGLHPWYSIISDGTDYISTPVGCRTLLMYYVASVPHHLVDALSSHA